MGASTSSPIPGGGTEGYHVLRVNVFTHSFYLLILTSV